MQICIFISLSAQLSLSAVLIFFGLSLAQLAVRQTRSVCSICKEGGSLLWRSLMASSIAAKAYQGRRWVGSMGAIAAIDFDKGQIASIDFH